MRVAKCTDNCIKGDIKSMVLWLCCLKWNNPKKIIEGPLISFLSPSMGNFEGRGEIIINQKPIYSWNNPLSASRVACENMLKFSSLTCKIIPRTCCYGLLVYNKGSHFSGRSVASFWKHWRNFRLTSSDQ